MRDHLQQMTAVKANFADGTFDLVTSKVLYRFNLPELF